MSAEINIEWVKTKDLKPHPKNRNKHPDDQIARLERLIKYQGWRLPIIVSTRSGCIVAGHGRLAAAKKMGLKTVPVSYQDFEDDDQEYAFLISDNAISEWAELSLKDINKDLSELDGINFDLDLLGFKDFKLDSNIDVELNEVSDETESSPNDGPKLCKNCGEPV